MRSIDWAASPVGPVETWPQSLRSVVNLLLHSKFPMFVLWGPARVFLYNDAYAPILGSRHPDAMGRAFFEVWPEVRSEIEPIIDKAFAGEGTYFEDMPVVLERDGYPELTYFTFAYSPVHGENGAVAGAFCTCSETTTKVLVERRQTFLLELEGRLRLLSDPLDIIATAEEALGRHLEVSRVGYGDVDEAARFFTTPRNWTDGTVAHSAGTHDLAAFGDEILDAMRRGETLVVGDVRADTRCNTPERLVAFDFIEVAAVVTVSLIKNGRLTAAMYVHNKLPRWWTRSEIKLIEDVAERTWSAVERARSETARRAAEAQVARVLENITEGFVLLDRNFRVLQINEAGLRLERRPASEIVGRTHWEAWRNSESSEVGRLYKKAMAERVPVSLEHGYTYPDGRTVWVEMRAYPSGDELAVFYRDVTERKMAEERLRESEERLRTLADNLPNGMVYQAVRDPDATVRFTYVSQAVERLHGLSVEQVLADPAALDRQVLEEFRPHLHKLREDADEDKNYISIELPMRLPSGEIRWFHRSAAPRRLPNGQVVWDGVELDITEMKRAEEALRESEDHYRHTVELNPQVPWTATPDGLLDHVARRWFELTGTSGLGSTWGEAIHPEDLQPSIDAWTRSFTTGIPYDIEHRVRLRNGEYRWMRSQAFPRRDAQGRIVKWYGTTENIHERKLAGEHQQLLINELNHRVKNTLATVQSIASQTLRNAQSVSEGREAIEQRLIALSRAHDVLTKENWEGASLREIIAQALEPYRSYGEGRIRLDGSDIRLSPRMALALSMAFHELATNAVKYGALSNDTGRILIEWSIRDDRTPSRLLLRWEERGGPPVHPPTRRGFGSRLIERSLAHDLGGAVKIDFAPSGILCSVDARLGDEDLFG
ncbi:PAS domain S-box protein [Microvirga sp. GCM10011540]|uniref:PAS domain S-box protein n=1 Tax=Microvirga sp. GCM10011540 TaxID=3317338 RepID=UPI003609654E